MSRIQASLIVDNLGLGETNRERLKHLWRRDHHASAVNGREDGYCDTRDRDGRDDPLGGRDLVGRRRQDRLIQITWVARHGPHGVKASNVLEKWAARNAWYRAL